MKSLRTILLLGILCYGCNEPTIIVDSNISYIEMGLHLPPCIVEQINAYKKNPDKPSNFLDANVTAYRYRDECVFIFNPGDVPDWKYMAYNQDCEVICEFGGITGDTTCEDFSNTAQEIGVIWRITD
ncbi:DUF6970 domain-containing protein [Roseivirga pacifica]|uniref:DUF6970 domain-containing protein n=1 Tax=Roseivirga pacifica TaxID=1267423 RepID=UPI003BA92A80